MKTSKKLFKTFFLTIILITAISCSKDDNSIEIETHANGIVKLTETPITINKSTFVIKNSQVEEVSSFKIKEIKNVNYFELISDKNIIYISLDEDNIPTGETVILVSKKNNDTYLGQNFDIENNDEEAGNVVLKGKVKNIDKDDDIKSLIITAQSSQLDAGTVEYTIEGNKAILTGGSLGTNTYNQILEINKNHPNVNIIELGRITGSIDDAVNVETGRLIRKAGYATHLTSTSEIYSGGVDLFCSGKTRTREAGSKIGVHSWCCYEGKTADQLPKNSPGHNKQLAYFKEMLGAENGPEFYFFTINAAPYNGIYLMKDNEISKYKLLTK